MPQNPISVCTIYANDWNQDMKILILTYYNKSNAAEIANQARDILCACGCTVVLHEYESYAGMNLDAYQSCDYIVAIGGDSTIIHAAKSASNYQIPVLGVNVGNLGFTAGLEKHDLPLLKALISGSFREEHRYLLQVVVSAGGKETCVFALNDAVVSGDLAKIIQYEMAIEGTQPYAYKADGFLFATATGSTAYSMSAGGPVIEPTMHCMVYTPICPHSLINRSVIFRAGTRLCVTIPENRSKLYLTIDGEPPIQVHAGDRIHFEVSDRYARMISLNDNSFYDTLNKKIIMTDNG